MFICLGQIFTEAHGIFSCGVWDLSCLTRDCLLCEAENFASAVRILEEVLPALQTVANAILRGQGFDYGAKATLQVEHFPTRKYGEFVLDEGEYLALIIRLGEGAGENWYWYYLVRCRQ